MENAFVVAFSGALDISRADEFVQTLGSVPDDARNIIVDLSAVTGLESMLLGSLLLIKFRWDREGRNVATLVTEPGVMRVLAILNVLERLNVVQSLDELDCISKRKRSPHRAAS